MINSFFGKIFLIALVLIIASCGETTISNNNGKATAKSSTSKTTTTPSKATAKKKKRILFFGDSLTEGYGLEDPTKGFVGIIQQKLDSLELNYQAVNAGVSGETSSGGNDRIDWILNTNPVDVFILELGANDGLRGVKTEETIKNLRSIFDKVKAKFPDAKLVLAGMLAPPNMGGDFTKKFAAIFPTVAKEYDAAFVPFLLDGVGGIPELNQRDGIHPTAEGHQILADNVWKILKDIL